MKRKYKPIKITSKDFDDNEKKVSLHMTIAEAKALHNLLHEDNLQTNDEMVTYMDLEKDLKKQLKSLK